MNTTNKSWPLQCNSTAVILFDDRQDASSVAELQRRLELLGYASVLIQSTDNYEYPQGLGIGKDVFVFCTEETLNSMRHTVTDLVRLISNFAITKDELSVEIELFSSKVRFDWDEFLDVIECNTCGWNIALSKFTCDESLKAHRCNMASP